MVLQEIRVLAVLEVQVEMVAAELTLVPMALAAPLVGNPAGSPRSLSADLELEVEDQPLRPGDTAVTVVPVVTAHSSGAAAEAVEERQEMQEIQDLQHCHLEVLGQVELQVHHQEFQLLQQLHIQLL